MSSSLIVRTKTAFEGCLFLCPCPGVFGAPGCEFCGSPDSELPSISEPSGQASGSLVAPGATGATGAYGHHSATGVSGHLSALREIHRASECALQCPQRPIDSRGEANLVSPRGFQKVNPLIYNALAKYNSRGEFHESRKTKSTADAMKDRAISDSGQ